MATVLDVVTDALSDLGVLAAGETPSGADGQLALRTLNRLVDMWAADRLQIYTVTRTTHTVSQVTSYTIGSGATINVARPVYIEGVGLVDTNVSPSVEWPLEALTDAAYRNWAIKALTSPIPTSWYYNPTFSSGYGTLYLLPVPTESGYQIAIYHPTAVAEFASLATTVSLPPGYREMLVSNLAVRLAPAFERQVPPALAMAAAESRNQVERANLRPVDLSFDAGALTWNHGYAWDIRKGGP